MLNSVFAVVLAAGIAAGVAFREAVVALLYDPPVVICAGDWCSGCRRVPGGVEIAAESAPDVVFSFEGLAAEVPLGYVVSEVASGAELFSGEGALVPLSLVSDTAVKVRFYALSGEVDWSEVSAVSAVQSEPLAASSAVSTAAGNASGSTAPELIYTGSANESVSQVGQYKLTVTVPTDENAKTEGFSLFGVTNGTETVWADSFQCGGGDSKSYGKNACSFNFDGTINVPYNGVYAFGLSVDDDGEIIVGDTIIAASLNHPSPIVEVELNAGLAEISGSFSSIGGPYDFSVSPFGALLYRKILGYGLQVSPAVITVPWEKGGSASGAITLIAPENPDNIPITTATFVSGASCVTQTEGGFTVDYDAFFASGAQPQTAEVKLIQSCTGSGNVETAQSILIQPSPTDVTGDQDLEVGLGVSDEAVLSGLHPDVLTYTLTGGDGLVSISPSANGSFVVTATAAAFQRAVALEEEQEEVAISLTWNASYGGTSVDSGVIDFTLTLLRSNKPDGEEGCNRCAEGTQTKSDCVSLSQLFGRTPLLAGMPTGALRVQAERRPERLFSAKALFYDHPMMRRLSPSLRRVTEPNGRVVSYDANGFPVGTKVSRDSRLIKQPDGKFHERFADRSIVEYDTSGVVVALISPQGVRATVADLGIELEYAASGAISLITSVADGVITITESANGFTLTRTEHDGEVVKTIAASWDDAHTYFALNDGGYPLCWEWVEANNDWTLVRGSGAESVREVREVEEDFSAQCYRITKTYSKGGVVALEETEVVDAVNGNAVVGRTSGGRTLLSATRVLSGNGVGKIASSTDALGAETRYTYDAYGRTLSETTVGASTNAVTYVYAQDVFDRRPWSTVETVNGEVVREETFSDVMLLDGTRIETTTVCGLATIRQFYPATSGNRFEAGKVQAVVRPDGRMTTYVYDADTLIVTQTEGVADEDFVFTLVEGKSTRTLTTYDIRGNAVRIEKEAWIGEAWHPLTWETRTYSAAHKHLGSVYSNGLSMDSRWNCSGPLWEVGTDTIATTNSYNTLKQMVTSTRHGSFGVLTTRYTYDAAGNRVRKVRGDLISERTYDTGGRLTSETDEQGRVTTYTYPNEQTTLVTSPSGATRQTVRDSRGRTVSVTGSGVTPEYHTYGANWQKVTYGSPDGARWIKTFTDGLGRTVRTETAGANGSVIASHNTYNDKGQLIRTETDGEAPVVYTYNVWGEVASIRRGERVPQETESSYILVEGEPWLEEVRRVGDLEQRSRTDAEGLVQISTDVRGNETVVTLAIEGAEQTTTTTLPGVTNPQERVTLDGVTVSETDASGVTQTSDYDVYRRLVSQTDGRNNTTTRMYDAVGRLATVTDAAGEVTAYAYDAAGNVSAVTNALGNVIEYAYDVRGNKVYEGGATYPVAYEYDVFGRKVKMTTFREETEAAEGDVTAWTYDAATGGLLAKTYADGRGVAYTLTNDGKMATRTDARGKVTTYTYNDYGELVSQTYSDDTADITMAYDDLGRVTQVTDAAGVTTFTYNDYGELATETNLKPLTRHYDTYGRDVGYSIGNERQATIAYDATTGRIAGMDGFVWEYLPGSNLKSKLTYPNGATAEWTYESNRDLLTQVKNTFNGAVISQYDYTNDLGGRRTEIGKSGTMMAQSETQTYGYNVRDELISGQGLTYNYDAIGNRTIAEGKMYTANELNQYTAIDTFVPQYDADGNQTLIKTSTGIWSVTYNAENRPVRWECGDTVVTMDFDRMGRRTFYKEMNGNTQVTFTRFVYKDYLCVRQVFSNSPYNTYKNFVWDPTETIATRPLKLQLPTMSLNLFYMHDGNKNVSDVVYRLTSNGVAAHYDYAPFGTVTRSVSNAVPTADITTLNPFRFSSEYHDDTLGLVYYNYRHYNPADGRWCGRDPVENLVNNVLFLINAPLSYIDILGLMVEQNQLITTITEYKFTIKMASMQEKSVSMKTKMQEAISEILKEEIKKTSTVTEQLISAIENVAKEYSKAEGYFNSIFFTCTSSGPYIFAWYMNLEVAFSLVSNCQVSETWNEEFSASEENLFCHIYNASELQRFATSVAEGAATLVRQINEVIELNKP